MKLFRVLFENSTRLLLLAIAIGGLSAFMGISLIALINQMIEQYRADFSAYGWRFIFLLVGLLASGLVTQMLLSSIGQRIIYRLRMAMVNRVLASEIEDQERAGAHRLYAVLTKDINDIGVAFSRLPLALYNTLLLLGCIGYLAYLSLPFLLLTLATTVLGLVVDRIFTRKMVLFFKRSRELEDTMFKQYEAVIHGCNELKIDSARRHYVYEKLLRPAAQDYRKTKRRADILWAFKLNWTVALIFSLMGVIVFLGVEVFQAPLEVITGFVLAIMFLRTPITILIDMVPTIIAGSVSLNKIEQLNLAEFNQAYTTNDSSLVATDDITSFTTLELKKIAYTYPSDNVKDDYRFALKPLDLTINSGETLFIIGGNGSGKSTFAKLLLGLYHCSQGEILLNDKVIGKEELPWYRSHFVSVLSNFYLFDHTFVPEENNISNTKKDELAHHYLRRLELHEKVTIKNGVLSTTDLSVGQRKRLALLNVYLSPSPLVLLDEWAADQDPRFRQFFYHELLPEMKKMGKTIIAITHDDKYFDCADRIFRFDAGVMSEITKNNSVSGNQAQATISQDAALNF